MTIDEDRNLKKTGSLRSAHVPIDLRDKGDDSNLFCRINPLPFYFARACLILQSNPRVVSETLVKWHSDLDCSLDSADLSGDTWMILLLSRPT